MQNNQFKAPLLQSAAIIGVVAILVIGLGTTGGGVGYIVSGLGKAIAFGVGLPLAIAFSIAILVGIFLASVAAVDSQQASLMYADLKKNLSLRAAALSKLWCGENSSCSTVTSEEQSQMKEQILQLQDANSLLQKQIEGFDSDRESLVTGLKSAEGENTALKEKMEEFQVSLQDLEASGQEFKALVDGLSARVEALAADTEIKEQLARVSGLQADSSKEITGLAERLNALEQQQVEQEEVAEEDGGEQQATPGIFSYIEKEDEQALFVEKIEEAVILEMTYAQIDEHLSESLPTELDKIIKDHPTLTKTYIRSVRDSQGE